jgi:cation diffusion facilitator family transporter
MVLEVVVGKWSGSMALVADGWHMASHAGALGFASLAYAFARRSQAQGRFAFGPGKVATLAGFTNAVVLAIVALLMGVEATERLVRPEEVRFAEALVIAAVGLGVNLVSARLLHPVHADDHHDHNLRSAYLHVVADVLTSVLAIAALAAGYLTGVTRLDAVAGAIGALVILWWAVGLIRAAVPELLDVCVDRDRITGVLLERLTSVPGARLVDVRAWSLGSGRLACQAVVATSREEDLAACHGALRDVPGFAHMSLSLSPPSDPPTTTEAVEPEPTAIGGAVRS